MPVGFSRTKWLLAAAAACEPSVPAARCCSHAK
jgi:hypothetical protein